MSRAILVTSGKGGVGKTTITSNLAAYLQKMGYDTVAIDANLTTPNLGIHLGMHLAKKTLHDVLRGTTRVENVLYTHPLGFKIIPGSISVNSLRNVKYKKLSSVVLKLLPKFDFVILDSAAGLGEETMNALDSVNEVLVITNPDLPSVTDALKTIKHVEKRNKRVIGVVINRVKKAKHDLSKKDVEDILGVPVISSVPEDVSIAKSIAKKIPVVHFDSNSPAAREIKKVAHSLTERHFYEKNNGGSLRRFFKWFGVFFILPSFS